VPSTADAPAGADEGADAAAAALRLTSLRDRSSVPPQMIVVPLDYRSVPMAIMRTDTSIKRWEHLKGRRVCVAAGGNHGGTLQSRYGAVEQIHPSATDALVALREGTCDAMVHDSTMLEELIRFPEWKKFSARLRGNQRSTLAFLVPAHDQARISALWRVAFDWDASGLPEQLVKKTVRDIAFEVYLEQDVPDCH
jgi:polar amino acid transport system substrate-binding protein